MSLGEMIARVISYFSNEEPIFLRAGIYSIEYNEHDKCIDVSFTDGNTCSRHIPVNDIDEKWGCVNDSWSYGKEEEK